MPLPSFLQLHANTMNLSERFGEIFGRYKIRELKTSSASSSSQAPKSNFDILLQNVTCVTGCTDTAWVEEQAVIVDLVGELRKAKFNEEQKSQATLFLLGALIHRYLRLIAKYDKIYGFFSSPINSKLFQAIRTSLGFNIKATAELYGLEDLKILDVLTIIQSLEAFKANMLLDLPTTKQPRYKSYKHLAEDKNFLLHLDQMIEEYKRRDAGTTNSLEYQYKVVHFIQSLSKVLAAEVEQVDKALDVWLDGVKKKHKDWSKVTFDILEADITASIQDESLRLKIFDRFDSQHIRALNLSTLTHDSFLAQMKLINASMASFILFGGYSLILAKGKSLHMHTKYCVLEVLKMETAPGNDEMLTAIKLLDEYLKNNPGTKFDCQLFGENGMADFNTFRAQTASKLQAKIDKETNSASAPAAMYN